MVSAEQLRTHHAPKTSRGLDVWNQLLPPTFSFDVLVGQLFGEGHANGAGRSFLELGCGEGHAVLQMQARFPRMQVECLNSLSYGKKCQALGLRGMCGGGATVSTVQDADGKYIVTDNGWHQIARSFRMPVLPKWPHIVYGDYNDNNNTLPWADSSFDLIISSNALNEGKVKPRSQVPHMLRDVIR